MQLENKEASSNKIISLEIFVQKLLSLPKIMKDVGDNEPLIIHADRLAKKVPAFKALGKMPIISFRRDENGRIIPTSLRVYRDGDRAVVINADLNRTENSDLKIINWDTNFGGKAVVEKGSLRLSIGVGFESDYLEDISEIGGEKGLIEDLNVKVLRDRPHPELPLRNLPMHTKFKVINSNAGISKKYKTRLVDIQLGEQNYYNVITNAFLLDCLNVGQDEFQINNLEPYKVDIKDKNSNKTKSETRVRVYLDCIDGNDIEGI